MESSQINFTVEGEPTPWKRPRFNGKSKHVFEDSKVKEYKKKVISAFWESGGGYFEVGTPLEVEISFYLQVPRSYSKKKVLDLITNGRPTKRPDNDNLYKGVTDGLNEIAYLDDAQIVDTHIHKFWSDRPRAEITIREVKT